MTAQQWRVTVERATCIGSGVCVGTAATHFTIVEERSQPNAELIDPDDAVLDAAESCPMEAILVRAAQTGEVLAPEP